MSLRPTRLWLNRRVMILMQLCSEVSNSVSSKAVVPAPAPVARGTVSSSEDISVAVAPVAVSGSGPQRQHHP